MTVHAVSGEVFDLVAMGDGGIVGALRAAQRSKRLLLLHEVHTTASAQAPELFARVGGARSMALLADLQREARAEVDALLLQPHVGAWATATLRCLLPGGEARPEDLGQLGALAAAAALRVGPGFEVDTFVRADGTVFLPTYGTARLERIRGWCRLRSGPGTHGVEAVAADGSAAQAVTIAPADSPDGSWSPLRRLRSSAAGLTLDVPLDDIDPYRGCGHLETLGRLDDAAVAAWQSRLDEAWSLLAAEHPQRAEALGTGVWSIVPLRPTDAASELSATCHEAVGALAMTPPRNALGLALALVHEFQHTKLSALLDLVPLLAPPSDALYYAPWRADPRPLRGLLQGIYAFLGLTRFWEVQRRRPGGPGPGGGGEAVAQFEFALGRDQVATALDGLEESGQLTPPGARFAAGMRCRLAGLAGLDVPPLPQELARLAYDDQRAAWRLRNLRPDADQVAAWAGAWRAGRPCRWPDRPEARLVDGGGPLGSQGRGMLLRRRLAGPPAVGPAEAEAEAQSATTSPADMALAAGVLDQAVGGYRADIARSPDDPAAWSGLALACRRLGASPAGRAFTHAPERVLALHHALSEGSSPAPDPVDLAAWVGAALPERASGWPSVGNSMPTHRFR